jgi:hypothetical protein
MRSQMTLHNRIQLFAGVLAIVAGLNTAIGQHEESAAQHTFSFNTKDTCLLQGLLKFGSDNQLPLGIVLQPGESLCRIKKSVNLKEMQAGQVIESILDGSDYGASEVDGVWVITPRSMPAGSSYLLNIHLEQFGTMRTTVQGLGIILAGYIRARLRPNEGYAGNILASTRAENVEPFTLQNVTVEQTANHIITLAGKGVWILYPVPSDRREMTAARHLYTYGYQDDAGAIARLSCSRPDSASEGKH